MFEGAPRAAIDEERDLRLRFCHAVRGAVVSHEMAVQTVLSVGRQDPRAAVVSAEGIDLQTDHYSGG